MAAEGVVSSVNPFAYRIYPSPFCFSACPVSHPSFQYTHPLSSIPSKDQTPRLSPPPISPSLFYFFCKTSHLPTLRHHDIERGTLAADARALDLAHDVHAIGDAAEDDVFVVQERGGDGADEELGAVGVGAGVLLILGMGAF